MSQRTLQGFFVKRSATATSEYASAEETETVELPESDEDQIFTDKTEDEPPSKQVINFLLDMYDVCTYKSNVRYLRITNSTNR